MKHYYVLIDQDNDGELIYKTLSQPNLALEVFGGEDTFPVWRFRRGFDEITVYGGALRSKPVGENLEEIELRVLVALDLV